MATYVVPASYDPSDDFPGLIDLSTGVEWVETDITECPITLTGAGLVLPDPTLESGDVGYIPDVSDVLNLWIAATCIADAAIPGNATAANPTVIQFPAGTYYRTEYGIQFGAPVAATIVHPEYPKRSTGWTWDARHIEVDFNGGGLVCSDLENFEAGKNPLSLTGDATIGDNFVNITANITPPNATLSGGLVGATLVGPGVPAGAIINGVFGAMLKLSQNAVLRRTQGVYKLVDPLGVAATISITKANTTTTDRDLGASGYTQTPDDLLVTSGQVLNESLLPGRIVTGPGIASIPRLSAIDITGTAPVVSLTASATTTYTTAQTYTCGTHTFLATAVAGDDELTVTDLGTLDASDIGTVVSGPGLSTTDTYLDATPFTRKAGLRFTNADGSPSANTSTASGTYDTGLSVAVQPRRQYTNFMLNLQGSHLDVHDGVLIGPNSAPKSTGVIAGPRIPYDPSREGWYGIHMAAPDNVVVDNMQVYGQPGDLIYFNRRGSDPGTIHTTNVVVKNSTLRGCGRQGVTINDGIGLEIFGNDISNTPRFVFDLEPFSNSDLVNVDIHDNTSEGGGIGFFNAALPHAMTLSNFKLRNHTLTSGHYTTKVGVLGTPTTATDILFHNNTAPATVDGVVNEFKSSTRWRKMMKVGSWSRVVISEITDYGLLSNTPQAVDLSLAVTGQTINNNFVRFEDYVVPFSALAIDTAILADATVDSAYSATIEASTVTGTAVFTAEGLPDGLAISTAGEITGTPTTEGTGRITVTVTDDATTADRYMTLIVAAAPSVSIVTTAFAVGVEGEAYSMQFQASGGTPPYTWSSTTLPTGLTLDADTGYITGTPSNADTTAVTVTVTDDDAETAEFADGFVINAPELTISVSIPEGTVGSAYSAYVTASGGTPPYTFTATELPEGISLATDGFVYGTPTVAVAYSTEWTVTDDALDTSVSQVDFTINAAPVGPSITTLFADRATEGVEYDFTFAYTDGTGPFLWTSGELPSGLFLDSIDGFLYGTPITPGTYSLSVTVTDALMLADSATIQLIVDVAPTPPGNGDATFYSTASAGSTLPRFAGGDRLKRDVRYRLFRHVQSGTRPGNARQLTPTQAAAVIAAGGTVYLPDGVTPWTDLDGLTWEQASQLSWEDFYSFYWSDANG